MRHELCNLIFLGAGEAQQTVLARLNQYSPNDMKELHDLLSAVRGLKLREIQKANEEKAALEVRAIPSTKQSCYQRRYSSVASGVR